MGKYLFLGIAMLLPLLANAADNPQPTPAELQAALEREMQWKNNDIGKRDRILPGFEPIRTAVAPDKVEFEVKNRIYHYENSLFPTQITAVGKKLLDAPIALKSNGRELFGPARIQLVRADDTRAEFFTSADNGSIRAGVYSTLEFDGFIWNRLVISPVAGPVTLDSLELDIQLPKTQALYLERHGVYDYENCHDPQTPLPQQDVVWPFSCSVWLGDEEAGFDFCAESDRNWDARDGHQNQIELKHLPQARLLRMKFIKAPKLLDKALVLEFGFLATPSKDLPRDWRSISHFWSPQITWTWSRCFGGGWDAVNIYDSYLNGRYKTDSVDGTYFYSSGRYYSPTPTSSFNDNKLFPEYLLYDRRINEVTREDYPAFAQGKPLRMNYNAGEYRCGSVASELGEMWLYNMREAARKHRIYFVYIDALGIRPDMNNLHGAGYVDEKGARQPTVAIRAGRDMVRRLYAMLDEESGGKFAVQIHGWDAMAPVLPYFTSRLDGEGYISEIGNHPHYSEVVPRELFRGCHRSRAHGVIGVFLPELSGTNYRIRAYSEEMVALTLLHDMPCDRKQTHYKVRFASYDMMTKYGMKNLDFYPYWKGFQPATSPDAGITISSYVDSVNPRRGIMVVANLSKNHLTATVKLENPGWESAVQLRDLSHNSIIPVKDGQAQFPVSALNFRLLTPEFK